MYESQLSWNCHNRNAKNLEIATGLSRAAMHVLTDAPPSVPPRGEPMVFVPTSRERKPHWERAQRKGIRKRYFEKLCRRNDRMERERGIGYAIEEGGSLTEMIARIEGGDVESLTEMVSRYAHVE